MTITKIAVYAIVCLILLMLLKKHVSQFSALAELAVVVFLIILILPDFTGLLEATKLLTNITGINHLHFTKHDVMRHPLVSKIIERYEKESNDTL